MALTKVTSGGISDIAAAVEGASDSNKFTDADHSKLNAIEASATADQTNAEIRTAVEAASDSNVFTDADHTKLNGVAASANNYVHPNHSGEVTSTADGATVIADNIVDEANLKVSNSPTNGQFLSAQSSNTGGLTWADIPAGVGGATGVDFNDNVKARFGTGNDLEIYHDATNSLLVNKTGGLRLCGDTVYLKNQANDENGLIFTADGAVDIYHNNVKKFETTADGVTVSGALTATAGSGSMLKVLEGGGSYAYLEAGGSTSYLEWKDGHSFTLRKDDNANYMIFNDNHTIDHFGAAGNWMKMWFAGSTNNEYFVSFRMSNNSQVGTIQTNGSSVSYNTSSDYRLKENVDYDWDATTRLKQLKPARFNWIADETNTVVDGFIAHEVQDIVPEAITGEKDAMEPAVLYKEGDDIPEGKSVGDVKFAEQISPQSIDQAKLVPLLVKAMQEQQTTIESLTARITALEG